MSNERKLDQATLRKMALRHNISLQWSWNYERMQALGFAYSLIPAFEKLYDTNEERVAAVQRHMQFYNTHPSMSAVIFGAATALEENYASDAAESIKIGLMGPLAGIGDTLQSVLMRPIIGVIAAGLAAEGSVFGPILMFLAQFFWFAIRFPLFNWGYKKSVGLIHEMVGEGIINKVTEVATILGLVVIGGFVPSIMSRVKTPLTYQKVLEGGEKVIAIQDVLDGILPYMIPLLFVGFSYWLLKSKKFSPLKTLLALIVVAFAAAVAGLL